MNLKELKEKIENFNISYDYEQNYCDLYNAVVDYENETQNFIGLSDAFNDFVNYDLAEEIARNELDNGGLVRLYYFLGDANLNNNIFKINGYGNLEDIDIDDFNYLKEELLDIINDNLEEEEE